MQEVTGGVTNFVARLPEVANNRRLVLLASRKLKSRNTNNINDDQRAKKRTHRGAFF